MTGTSLHLPACLCAAAAMGMSVVRAAETAAPLPGIPRTREPIVVDGKPDEPAWALAPAIPVDVIWGKGDERTETPRMTAKYLWDDFYLYIAYEVQDANLAARGNGQTQGPEDNRRESCDIAPELDVVEFFVVFDDFNFFWEIHHNADNDFGDVLALVNLPAWKAGRPAIAAVNVYFGADEYVKDHGAATLTRAVALKPGANGTLSTVNDASDEDAGYTGEIRLPWFGIGAPAAAQTWVVDAPGGRAPGPWNMDGREVSILAVLQSNESDARYCTSATGLGTGFFHLGAAQYPRYRLSGEPAQAAPTQGPEHDAD